MNFIRRLASYLFFPAAIALILAVAALIPAVQTWLVGLALDRHPEWHTSLGSLTARFGQVEVADLKWESDGATLTVPALTAHLPIVASLLKRDLPVRSVVAKGWTLDLSHRINADSAAAAGDWPKIVAGMIHHALNDAQLPVELSLDGAELEGDILVGARSGQAPVRLHVILKGGGLGPGRVGAFTFEASGSSLDSVFHVFDLSVQSGQLQVGMTPSRTFNRLQAKTDLHLKAGAPVREVVLALDFIATRDAKEEAYQATLAHDGRIALTLAAHLPDATRVLSGNWQLDLNDSDIVPFAPEVRLPTFNASGRGEIEVDATFNKVRTSGTLTAKTGGWGKFAPSLAAADATTFDLTFGLTREGSAFRVDPGQISITGQQPIAVIRTLQAFEIDADSGQLKASKPGGDLLEATVQALPLSWLPNQLGGITFAGGSATGAFVVGATVDGFEWRQKTPLSATGVTLERAGKVIGSNLDFFLTVTGNYRPTGWEIRSPDFTISAGDHRLLSAELQTARRVGTGQPVSFGGKWNADLAAIIVQPGIVGLDWITSPSVSGDFAGSIAATTKLEGQWSAAGRVAGDFISGKFSAEIGSNHAITFTAPLKIAADAAMSEVSVEGTWFSTQKSGSRIGLRLGGKQVAVEHLRQLAAPAAALAGVPFGSAGAAQPRDVASPASSTATLPFWGDCTGRVAIAFDALSIGPSTFKSVRGTFDLTRDSVHLNNGLYVLADNGLAQVSGAVTFDPTASTPYRLQGTADGGEIDASPLFGSPGADKDPYFKGHFAVTSTLSGAGTTLADLIKNTQQEFKLKSTNGIIRLLGVSVSDAIPAPAATPVSDAAADVGSVVGSFFGFKKGLQSGEVKLPKNTEAVLGFTYHLAEIGYKEISITATRGVDRTIKLSEINIVTADEHLTGTGEISYLEGQPLFRQPLSAELTFAVRGQIADLLASTTLLSAKKDELGYTVFNEPAHFGGSLGNLDKTRWHDLLAKAAVPKPDPIKKEGKAVPKKSPSSP